MNNQLITLTNISLAFGLNPLLSNANLQITKGERVCLIGRNGAGKSSLLKIIAGDIPPDSGEVWRKPDLRIARLEQELPEEIPDTVYDFVARGLAETGKLLSAFHTLTLQLNASSSSQNLQRLEQLQKQLDSCNAWHYEQAIKTVLQRLELESDKKVAELSGGWQRRAALARALVSEPDILLLDEPTNHLDITAIQWLENELLSSNTGILFITHDRALLQRLATRIIELDRGYLTSWPGDYANFLRRKEEMLHAEAKHNEEFDKKLAQEERWIRQGIKARRTRNEGRVRALKALREERRKRYEVPGKAAFTFNTATSSGRLVIEAEKISHGFNDKLLIKNFSLRIMRGDRIGLIGPNGVGKSTLLNILLGKINPQQGSVKHGSQLQIAYFDQLRKTLDREKTVLENVAHGRDVIEINGKTKHVMSYLNDFLFTPQRAFTPVKALSGGECGRLVLARLFIQPANLLVLDEPTNDLDIETLELLEDLLTDYQATLLLVSHDRAFLDNVVTSTLVFEGEGIIKEYVGGYQDWLHQAKSINPTLNEAKVTEIKPLKKHADCSVKKLSYKEQREINELPKKIEQLESEQFELQEIIANPKFYQQSSEIINEKLMQLKQLDDELVKLYARWEELEELKAKQTSK